MNLLYLHAHDLGRWIAPYGFEVETPHLSRLAGEQGSVLFSNAHSAAPTCSPSRAALLTGMPPHECGMMGLMHRGFRLRDPRKHLAVYLQENGYETALSGIQHIQPGSELTGYDRQFKGVRSRDESGEIDWRAHDRSVAEQAAGFLRSAGETKPFFLDCGFWLPHRPFPEPDEDIDEDSFEVPLGIPDTKPVRRDMAGFLTAVRHMDRCCGVVLDALAENGHADDTLVIFTTDHGPPFPGHKCTLTAWGTGVAMILRIPGRETEATDSKALVSQLDLFPTICDLLGLENPDWLKDSFSLRPLMEGTAGSIRKAVFSEITYHAGYEPVRSIRTAHDLFIRIFEEDLSPVPANIDDSAMKDEWISGGWLNRPREPVQLFDLRKDPFESQNVAGHPRYAKGQAHFEILLENWMRESRDPLLDGPVPVPKGGYANDRSHLSPTIGEP